jgi:hypothetical protein
MARRQYRKRYGSDFELGSQVDRSLCKVGSATAADNLSVLNERADVPRFLADRGLCPWPVNHDTYVMVDLNGIFLPFHAPEYELVVRTQKPTFPPGSRKTTESKLTRLLAETSAFSRLTGHSENARVEFEVHGDTEVLGAGEPYTFRVGGCELLTHSTKVQNDHLAFPYVSGLSETPPASNHPS